MQKKIYITAGILIAIVVAILLAFSAGSTTYTISSPSDPVSKTIKTTVEAPATSTAAENETVHTTSSTETHATAGSLARPTTTPEKTETASTLSSTDEKQTSYTITVEKSGTVLEIMQNFARTSHFDFKTKNFPGLGVMVEEINGLRNGDGYYWILYVNGKTSDKGASAAKVSTGDSIEWKYEKGY